MKKAVLFEKTEKGVRCRLCAHQCVIKEGGLGVCKVRKNIGGELFALNYNKIAATHADPIEKKPLYHFLPGSVSYSVAAMGCNFSCSFCQNNSLSMVEGENDIYGQSFSPSQLVDQAMRYGSQSISYTYSEPTIYFELMLETARLAKKNGLKNVMVTNGHMTTEAFNMIAPYMDAANIDLKAFTDSFYKKYCNGNRKAVMNTIKNMREYGTWVEVTTLLIPTLNSDEEEIREMVQFLHEIDPEMPWHVSRFFPQFRMQDVPPTPVSMIYKALEIAEETGLKYVYAGNITDDKYAHTNCPNCNTRLIERNGYSTKILSIENGKCSSCNHKIAGVW